MPTHDRPTLEAQITSIEHYEPQLSHRIMIAVKTSPMTQREIAEQVGVSHASITHWMKGRNYPRVNHLVKLSEITGCPWLLDLRSLPFGCMAVSPGQSAEKCPRGSRRDTHRFDERTGFVCARRDHRG